MTMHVCGQTQPLQPETQQTQTRQSTETSPNKTAAQRRYDPLAGKEHLRGGIWDNALKNINPCDIDYGARVDAWQRMIVGETIANYVFWMAVAMSLGALFAILYIYWLHKDRARRLDISVNLLAQIANAFIDARDHALDAIERHNQLADDYNAMAEEMAVIEQQRAENQRRARADAPDQTLPDSVLEDISVTHPVGDATACAELDSQVRARLRQGADAQAGRRLAQQINALQEKNKALRLSLNEAIADNERLKRSYTEMTGA
jgi:hypothetical protein